MKKNGILFRVASGLLAAALTLSLTACGGSSSNSDASAAADSADSGATHLRLTDSLGRVHGDAQFAGSSSVPAHVEMMGLIGMGNNPMVGATVACAVAAAQANA